MFLGVIIKRTNLEARGIGIMVGWTLWILIFVILIEFTQNKFKKEQIIFSLNNFNGEIFFNAFFFLT